MNELAEQELINYVFCFYMYFILLHYSECMYYITIIYLEIFLPLLKEA